MSRENVKQHILISTIDAIEKHGLSNLTTRLIADEAGVNNAALHYYFGTKEQLVDAALDQTARHMLEDTEAFVKSEGHIEERIKSILIYLIDGIQKYPNIIRAHMIGPLFYKERQESLLNLLDSWISLTAEALIPFVEVEKMTGVRMHLNMIFSQILMAGLFNYPTSGQTWMDFQDEKVRGEFLDEAIRLLLNS
ncbi:TetR/AcrR family transcriptional regulator [Chloroflexota bacterium]|nr:TetR/AcrR family transcriptional regulator [Chloroflexota bacterium]